MIPLLPTLEFRHPILLVAVVLALPIYWLARRSAGHVAFSSLAILPAEGRSWRTRLVWLPDAAITCAAFALAIALAGPRVGDKNSLVRREGIAIMMVVDISGSMQALDLSTDKEERTRLDAVKHVLERFVLGGDGLSGRPDDAIGIVSFARYADAPCPLTLDRENLTLAARSLAIVTDRTEDGTAIGDGLGLAVERLRESRAKSRIAILLTDGMNNAGAESPLGAAELAKAQGVKVYTIGAGTVGTAPVRVHDPFTGRMVLRPVEVEIDEPTLREIAARTAGQYFRATDARALEAIYREIDRLERVRIDEERFREYREYYPHALAFGLLFACVGFFLRDTVFRRLP